MLDFGISVAAVCLLFSFFLKGSRVSVAVTACLSHNSGTDNQVFILRKMVLREPDLRNPCESRH